MTLLLKLRLHVVGPVEPIFVREVDDGNPRVAFGIPEIVYRIVAKGSMIARR